MSKMDSKNGKNGLENIPKSDDTQFARMLRYFDQDNPEFKSTEKPHPWNDPANRNATERASQRMLAGKPPPGLKKSAVKRALLIWSGMVAFLFLAYPITSKFRVERSHSIYLEQTKEMDRYINNNFRRDESSTSR